MILSYSIDWKIRLPHISDTRGRENQDKTCQSNLLRTLWYDSSWPKMPQCLGRKFRNQDLLFTEIRPNLKSWKGYSLSPKVPWVVVQTKRKMQIEFNCWRIRDQQRTLEGLPLCSKLLIDNLEGLKEMWWVKRKLSSWLVRAAERMWYLKLGWDSLSKLSDILSEFCLWLSDLTWDLFTCSMEIMSVNTEISGEPNVAGTQVFPNAQGALTAGYQTSCREPNKY